MILIVLIVVIVISTVLGILFGRNFIDKVSHLPPKSDKVGIYKGKVKIETILADYKFVTKSTTMHFTAIIKEINRFGDKIEVKYINLINTPNKYTNQIMSVLRDKHTLIPLKDVEWEYDTPDVVIDRENLRLLLNQNEIELNGIHIKIDKDIEYSEILDIVVEETNK